VAQPLAGRVRQALKDFELSWVAQPLGLNFRVAAPSWFFEGAEVLVFPWLVLYSVNAVDSNSSMFPD
jgi:hypothetical protein